MMAKNQNRIQNPKEDQENQILPMPLKAMMAKNQNQIQYPKRLCFVSDDGERPRH
jgi:hypothetical protein